MRLKPWLALSKSKAPKNKKHKVSLCILFYTFDINSLCCCDRFDFDVHVHWEFPSLDARSSGLRGWHELIDINQHDYARRCASEY